MQKKETQKKRESKDIRTKSKSSISPSRNASLMHMDSSEEYYVGGNNAMTNSSLSRHSFTNEAGNTQGAGKVKLKIKVDPSRYRDTLNTSPSSFFTSTPTYIKKSKADGIQYLSSPLLQSALMASTTKNADNMSTSLAASPSTFSEKLFNCVHCPKQFSIRSSFLRHVRTQHGIDTRSQQFLQHLKHQVTYPSSIAKQEMSSYNSSLPRLSLEPSTVNSNKFNSVRKLHSKGKGVSNNTYGKLTPNRKRKRQEIVEHESVRPSFQPSVSNSGKKIKLSLKLGKGKRKVNDDAIYHTMKNDSPNLNTLVGNRWQKSSFQELSPATSPALKVARPRNSISEVEGNPGKNTQSHLHKNALSPQYAFDSPSNSPSIRTDTKTSKRNSVQDLMCPTCDKTFPAKSIFERHIKSYKHGRYEIYEHATPPPSYIPSSGDEQLPHLNPVLQPTIELGGREVNKYECHLCNQVFLRVRDLAKHRERMMCTAWIKN